MTDRPTASTINDAQLDQLYDDLAAARAALVRNDAPAGARWLHVEFTSPDATTANTSALALRDHLAAELPGVGMRITTNAVETDPLTAAEEARLTQSGISTPGCDCGHEGMGVSWHGDECPWRSGVLDGTVPALREQLAAALRSLAIIGDTPPRLLVPVFTGGGSQLAQIVDWRPLGDLVDTLHAIVTGHAATITEGRDRARDTLTLIGERCDMADILHKPITTDDVRAWLRGTRCARARAAAQPARTTPDNPAGSTAPPAPRDRCPHCPDPLCPEDCPECGSPIHDLDAVPAQPTEWTPPPPGSTAEQLPETLLALIADRLPDYTSTACQTADRLACTACYPGSGIPRPQYDEIREHAERLHNRCRLNHKFTGQLCSCGCHPEEQQPYPPIGLTNQENQS